MSTYSPSPPGSGLPGFLRGLTYPLRGIRFLFANRAAWPYAALPALVNGVVILVIAAIAFHQYDVVFEALQPDALAAAPEGAPWWKTFWRPIVNGLIGVVVALLLTVGSLLGGLLSASLLAGPFHEKLSEVIESIATGQPPPDEPINLKTLTRDSTRAVFGAAGRLALWLALWVPFLILSLIPVVGIVGVVGMSVYSAFFAALNFTDPTLERQKIKLPAKLRWARGSLAPWMGFGAGLMLMLLIPLVGFLLAPTFVTAGTLLWLDVRAGDDAPA